MSYQHLQQSLRGHMPGLDGLRAIAILIVVWHQAGTTGQREIEGAFFKIFHLALNSGWTGVQLFFVLSGFLITSLLLEYRNQQSALRIFYIRRILRIFPLYYFVLLMTFLVLPLLGLIPKPVDGDQLWYWLYLSNWASVLVDLKDLGYFAHFWSLAIEEQFYIFWPLLVLFLPQRQLIVACLLLIFSAIISRAVLFHYFPEIAHKAVYVFTITRVDALAIGALLSIAVRNRHLWELLRFYAPWLLCGLTMAILSVVAIKHNFSAKFDGISIFNQTLAALWFSIALFYSIDMPSNSFSHRYKLALSNHWLKTLAKYSYAIYVFHLPVIYLWFKYLAPDLTTMHGLTLWIAINLNCLVVLLISFFLARCSWIFIEMPFLKLKGYLTNDMDDTNLKKLKISSK